MTAPRPHLGPGIHMVCRSMMMFGKVSRQLCSLKKIPWSCDSRYFWQWLNTVFNKVDYDRIRDVGPDRAASEWLLRCGARVRYCGQQKWTQDYNNLPTGPLDRYKIQAIDATDSCIMSLGLAHMEGLEHVEKITLSKCHYIEDSCLKRLSQLEKLQKSLLEMEIIACGNVTDTGILALQHFRNLRYLFLSDLPGIKDKENLAHLLKVALPSLELKLNLK
ncbi:ATP synthase subunit s, mitochondrial isoform X3 [Meriones unguiculatus]|uniref:ATP synthase subunit s, mitochondrial isoform X3 n=1 Tax=Meriones unguiculatus TaxID=10047 RepID=UPI000B4F27D0|nr:ATP synthase subunit s, mitochondrial isoform X3 [Meriones unguiculatus]XP_060243560.1 ATP synthase subunit s, mitochondrial isoform X3 [Meriones unguiculatus]XP_060243561.1 ATP synthase subunit s, mitochondrial isoform X3 [Meriones unguiculatus]XP_060243562.1 ATP synthase subunit s, mitochondrial isoform X3 [Meriones unguiculatus]